MDFAANGHVAPVLAEAKEELLKASASQKPERMEGRDNNNIIPW